MQPDIVAFGRHYLSDSDYSTVPAVSSKYTKAHTKQVKTQIYEVTNDFLPLVAGTPMIQVPDIISLGEFITVTWYSDTASPRKSHRLDWVGLYHKGDCRRENPDSLLVPSSEINVDKPDYMHQCFIAREYVQPDLESGTVSFKYVDSYSAQQGYHSAGEYEVRYFYGDSRDGNGYKCGLQPGTTQEGYYCALHPKGISAPISVVKSGPAEGMENVPGMEVFTDPDDGALYASSF